MVRYVQKVKRIKQKVNDPLWGTGYFVKEVKSAPVLQYQDGVSGEWKDVPTVTEEVSDGSEGE